MNKRKIDKYATDFWACSNEAMPSLFNRKQLKSDKAKVIHNAINLEKFASNKDGVLRQELGLTESDIVIGSVGRIASVKNYPLAADIIKELWNRNINIHYVIAGDKQDSKQSEYLKDLIFILALQKEKGLASRL